MERNTVVRSDHWLDGIPDGLPSPLPPLPITLGFQSQKSNELAVGARIIRLVTRLSLLVRSFLHSGLLQK